MQHDGFQQNDIMTTDLVDERRAAELVNGRALWRQDEIDDVRLLPVCEVACRLQAAIPYDLDYDDDQLHAMAALGRLIAGTAWQTRQSLRTNIEIASPWSSVRPVSGLGRLEPLCDDIILGLELEHDQGTLARLPDSHKLPGQIAEILALGFADEAVYPFGIA